MVSVLETECLLFQDSDGIIYLRGCNGQKCRFEPCLDPHIGRVTLAPGTAFAAAFFAPNIPIFRLKAVTIFDVLNLVRAVV